MVKQDLGKGGFQSTKSRMGQWKKAGAHVRQKQEEMQNAIKKMTQGTEKMRGTETAQVGWHGKSLELLKMCHAPSQNLKAEIYTCPYKETF